MTIEWRTIGFPDHLMRVKEGSARLSNIQITSGSQLANFIRATGLIAQRWTGKLDMSTMTRAQWQEWDSFIARLSGQAVLFEIQMPGQVLPLGAHAGYSEDGAAYAITGTTITGTEILNGATSGLILEDAPRYSQAIMIDFGDDMAGEVVLTHGDKFGLRGNLYMVTGVVTADANGQARVPFRWKLHRAAFVGDVVSFYKPTCRVMLASAGDGDVTIDTAINGSGGLSFVEVPYT